MSEVNDFVLIERDAVDFIVSIDSQIALNQTKLEIEAQAWLAIVDIEYEK